MSLKQKFCIKSFILLSAVLFTGISSAETLVYRSISGPVYNVETIITEADNGYLVKHSSPFNVVRIYNTDSSFSVLKWKITKPYEGTDLTAERSGNTISITGQLKNKKLDKQIKLNELPWYQLWAVCLKAFVKSDKDSTLFWAMDTDSLRIAKFKAEKIKTEKIEVNGRETESVCVKASPTGLLKAFMGARELWFRKSDGTCVYSKMDNLQLTMEK